MATPGAPDVSFAKSVLDCVEEELRFLAGCFAERDDADFMGSLRMDDRDGNTGKQPQGDKPLFAIGEPIILQGEDEATKDSGCINEIEPVLLEVQRAFALGPGELHQPSVYTIRQARNKAVVAP